MKPLTEFRHRAKKISQLIANLEEMRLFHEVALTTDERIYVEHLLVTSVKLYHCLEDKNRNQQIRMERLQWKLRPLRRSQIPDTTPEEEQHGT